MVLLRSLCTRNYMQIVLRAAAKTGALSIQPRDKWCWNFLGEFFWKLLIRKTNQSTKQFLNFGNNIRWNGNSQWKIKILIYLPRLSSFSEIPNKSIHCRCYFFNPAGGDSSKRPDSIDNFYFQVLLNKKGSLVKWEMKFCVEALVKGELCPVPELV